ncbi:hypothetical protein BURMUCGD1_0168 [Burkholderia multivorans CGD1]|nr:hypothetical protein BURMUCGD1_0168 [Burkholderia multivorans CGD1]
MALNDMGFSLEHVDELQANGGFPSTSIRNNTQMITYLRSVRGAVPMEPALLV